MQGELAKRILTKILESPQLFFHSEMTKTGFKIKSLKELVTDCSFFSMGQIVIIQAQGKSARLDRKMDMNMEPS
jgi:hypothetical protein